MTKTIATTTAAVVQEITVQVEGKRSINITNDAAKRAQVARFKELKALEKAVKDELGDDKHPGLAADIKNWMDGADEAIVLGNPVLKKAKSGSTVHDDKALLEGWPDAFEATVTKREGYYYTAL